MHVILVSTVQSFHFRHKKRASFKMGYTQLRLFLLLLSGDVETNPGPPKRGPPGGRPKEPTKEEQMKALLDKVWLN